MPQARAVAGPAPYSDLDGGRARVFFRVGVHGHSLAVAASAHAGEDGAFTDTVSDAGDEQGAVTSGP